MTNGHYFFYVSLNTPKPIKGRAGEHRNFRHFDLGYPSNNMSNSSFWWLRGLCRWEWCNKHSTVPCTHCGSVGSTVSIQVLSCPGSNVGQQPVVSLMWTCSNGVSRRTKAIMRKIFRWEEVTELTRKRTRVIMTFRWEEETRVNEATRRMAINYRREKYGTEIQFA